MRIRAVSPQLLGLSASRSPRVVGGQDRPRLPVPVIWQIDLVPNGHTFAATQPVLKNGVYTFESYRSTRRRAEAVSASGHQPRGHAQESSTDRLPDRADPERRARLARPARPEERRWVFRPYRAEHVMSIRQRTSGGSRRSRARTPTGPGARQGRGSDRPARDAGRSAVAISSPTAAARRRALTACPRSGGAPTGNWSYQGTPGTSDAYGPRTRPSLAAASPRSRRHERTAPPSHRLSDSLGGSAKGVFA
jgi:hypothetical protein